MREAIRLSPTAPMRVVEAHEDITIGGGKYFIPKGGKVVINTEMSQRDPKVWGEDVSCPVLHHIPWADLNEHLVP